MPKLTQTATVSTTEEVHLDPRVRTRLVTKLKAYAEKHAQLKALEAEMDTINAEVEDIRSDIGEQSVKLEGFTVTLVAPTYRKFSAKKFVAAGGDLALYNAAIEEKPKRAYTKISVPGQREHSYEEE